MFGKHNRRKKESETPLKRRLTSIKQSACPFETTHTNISSKTQANAEQDQHV